LRGKKMYGTVEDVENIRISQMAKYLWALGWIPAWINLGPYEDRVIAAVLKLRATEAQALEDFAEVTMAYAQSRVE
jgi:hypothetical protein